MKKINLLLVLFLLTNLFAFAQGELYESAWVDKHKEMNLITIVKEKGSFWLNGFGEKNKISGTNEMIVNINGKDYQINLISETGVLLFNGSEFIPEFKSKKRQFAGRWKSESNETIYDIKLSNGGITWDIIDSTDKSIRFYPKLTDNGFTFTFGKQQLFFTVKDGVMTDSSGERYLQITRI